LAFAVTLSVVAQFDHSHFVVLYFLPVIAGAFRLPPLQLGGLLLLICSATFLEVFLEASRGRTVAALEYYENTIVCLSYITVAIIVKQIVDQVEERERALELSMQELKSTQSKLLEEERLAAVGRLAAGLAHEIRNPIALIAGHLSMHQERVAKDLATLLSTEISRLETLTTDFLSYARSTPPHKEQSELRPTLEYVAALVRPHAERANVALSVEVKQDIAFAFDSHQIQQALLNLVLNAIQASRSNSVVNLCARALGNDVEIEVENSGEVISDGQLKQLFEPFSSTKTGGTGLGLAISRSIARAHGGDLRLRKNTNNMVSFVVTLPLSKD
ncbi:MAG: GHKL domain-containing protein, partial [Planctomycetes bacterium]|nr:GHKL domain-containing protein [Planctomycetota bacterium]